MVMKRRGSRRIQLMDENDYTTVVTKYSNSSSSSSNAPVVPIAYICRIHDNTTTTTTSTAQIATIEYFYDVVFDRCSSISTSSSTQTQQQLLYTTISNDVSYRLLQTAATMWSILPNGDVCINPTTNLELYNNTWIVGVETITTSSTTPQTIVTDFGCQILIPNRTNDECCQVMKSKIIFHPIGSYYSNDLKLFVNDTLSTLQSSITVPLSSSVDSGTGSDTMTTYNYHTAMIYEPQFIEDTTLGDKAHDQIKEPNRSNDNTANVPTNNTNNAVTQQSEERESITITGGFIIASLITVLFGVFFVMVKRYHRKGQQRRLHTNIIDDTMIHDHHGNDTTMEDDFHVTVEHDTNYNSFPIKRPLTICNKSLCISETEDNIFESELMLDSDDDDEDNNNYNKHRDNDSVSPRYAFDLGRSFKQNVMGTYATNSKNNSNNNNNNTTTTTIIPVVAPYPIASVTTDHNNSMNGMMNNISACDSEAEDSWAQTDGTVGSLEERLEEITAEI